MPFEIQFENSLTPAGYAVAAKRRDDETALIEMMGFTSSEDGGLFISRLEGIPSGILNRIPFESRIHPPNIHELLAVVRPERATVYINESRARMKVQAKHPINVGEAVFNDDIADVQAIDFERLHIPPECGIVFVFSIGWCKGFFFDLKPVAGPKREPRNYDLGVLLGQCFSQVFFQELFNITDTTWNNLLSQQWFPFRGLSSDTLKQIISQAENNWPIDEVLDVVAGEVRARLRNNLREWIKNPIFLDHATLLEQAVDRFQNDDFVSCGSILYPRIEGILRTFHHAKGETTPPNQNNLSESAVNNPWVTRHDRCVLMPDKFQRYLREVYFAGFDVTAANIPVSRHSVSHGVAPAQVFSLKSAIIAFLVIQQLGYYCVPSRNEVGVK
jgi:hypothetical protein